MTGTTSLIGPSVIIIEAFLLLLPTTLLYLFGSLFLATIAGVSRLQFWGMTVILSLPGYSLYSLWWLVLMHRKVPTRKVPKYIWAGMVVGGIVATMFLLPFLSSGFKPPNEFISFSENMETMLAFCGGPIIVAVTLLVVMKPWRMDRH